MIPRVELEALRLHTAWSAMPHVATLRVRGEDAFDAVDAVCPADLYLRDGQLLHTLLLTDDGRPAVDLYVGRDDEDFLLLAEGLEVDALSAWLRDTWPAGLDVEIVDLRRSHTLLSLHGPWAWELMAELVGPGVVGLPYLTLYHEPDWICVRAGKTGEFGYDLLVRNEAQDSLRERIQELGQGFGLQEVGLAALDQCALENGFFNVRREGRSGATPLELQLQWRLSAAKPFPGAGALTAQREAGLLRRLTTVVADAPFQDGDRVWLDGQDVGEVVNNGACPFRGDHVGLALLQRATAHAGLEGFTVGPQADGSPLRTVSPPVLHNRSLFVQPQKHSYRTREEHTFPTLAPDDAAHRSRP